MRRRKPIINSDGDVEKWKHLGFYYFVHDKELRDSYDTYKVIEALSEAGFKEQNVVENNTVIFTDFNKTKNKR